VRASIQLFGNSLAARFNATTSTSPISLTKLPDLKLVTHSGLSLALNGCPLPDTP
jgi:hypothetical protein